MPNVKRLTKWGNSTGVVIDRALLQQLNLDTNDEVEVSLERNAIVIRAHQYATDDEADSSAVRMFQKHQKSLKGLAKR